MILKRLYDFSQTLDLLPAGFVEVTVQKRIELDASGKLIQVLDLGKKKLAVPREQPQRTVAVTPRLIADNANYVLGVAREKDKPGQAEERNAAFRALLSKCATETDSTDIKVICAFLDSPDAEAARSQVLPEDYLDFTIAGERPLDRPDLRAFWAAQLASDQTGMCMVTGIQGPVVERMPIPIKGIPDGQVSGTALVSVNNKSGESYGLEAGLNSPIGKAAAEGICNALNYLLATPEHRLVVGKCVYVAWLTGTKKWDFRVIDSPDPSHVKDTLKSVGLGERGPHGRVRKVRRRDANDFFVLCLSANASRIVVRDFMELTLDEAQENIREWFTLTELVGKDGLAAEPFGIRRLASSLFREQRDMPAHVPTALVNSALRGHPIPEYLLGLAIKRNLAMQGPYSVFNNNGYLATDRMALIKAILTQKSEENINLIQLNETHPDPAYHCGRLLAVLDSIQRAAQGKVNATVVDRFYGSACASPASVCGNLLNDAQAHLAKLRRDKGDGWAQQKLATVLGCIPEFPKTLSLERQGLFALGFYHQKAADSAAAQAHKAENESGDEA